MKIIEVKDEQSVKAFHDLPFSIYKGDPNWIPHLKQDVEKVFNSDKNKAFQGGQANRWILNNEEGETIGRIAAFIEPKYYAAFRQPTGGIGFFECINDQNAAFLLFDTAKNWLAERGMKAMDGPIILEKKMHFGV